MDWLLIVYQIIHTRAGGGLGHIDANRRLAVGTTGVGGWSGYGWSNYGRISHLTIDWPTGINGPDTNAGLRCVYTWTRYRLTFWFRYLGSVCFHRAPDFAGGGSGYRRWYNHPQIEAGWASGDDGTRHLEDLYGLMIKFLDQSEVSAVFRKLSHMIVQLTLWHSVRNLFS